MNNLHELNKFGRLPTGETLYKSTKSLAYVSMVVPSTLALTRRERTPPTPGLFGLLLHLIQRLLVETDRTSGGGASDARDICQINSLALILFLMKMVRLQILSLTIFIKKPSARILLHLIIQLSKPVVGRSAPSILCCVCIESIRERRRGRSQLLLQGLNFSCQGHRAILCH